MTKCYFFVLIYGVLFSCSEGKTNVAYNEIKLRKVESFPSSVDSMFLANPVNFSFTEDYIFISDQMTSSVKSYDFEGNFVRSIGRKGRGPAELMFQHRVAFENKKLYINDQGNKRMSVYDIGNNSFEEFLFKEQVYSFSVHNSIIYAYLDYPFLLGNDINEVNPIQKYDSSMNKLESVGKFLNFTGNMFPNASLSIVRAYNDTLYSSYLGFPLIDKYVISDTLSITKIDLDNDIVNYKERIPENYLNSTYLDPNERLQKKLFNTFDVNEKGIFVNLHDKEKLIIDHFDFKGSFVGRYLLGTKHSERYIVRDIKVLVKKNQLKFYVLNLENGFPKVDVYYE